VCQRAKDGKDNQLVMITDHCQQSVQKWSLAMQALRSEGASTSWHVDAVS